MISTSIKISIVLSLGLILLAQMLYLPLMLSLIFVICIICLWICLSREKPFAKGWIFLLTSAALLSIYFEHQSFVGVDAGVAVLSTFLFAKALETKNKRDLIILFNFALFVTASSFLFSQSLAMALCVLLSLMSCLIGLYRIQRSEFSSTTTETMSLKQDLKHVGKFLLYALPFFVLLFIFFPRLPPLWHIPIPENKGITGISDSMSPGDIAQLSQSTALAFRIIGDTAQLPPRPELYWRALVLDEYDGQRWSSSFFNQQPLDASYTLQQQKGWDYQYLASDPSVLWVMGLEQSIPLERRYYNRQDRGIVPRRLTQRVEPIKLRWLVDQKQIPVENSQLTYYINTKYQAHLDLKAQRLATQLMQQSAGVPTRYIELVLNWYKKNQFVYTLTPGLLGQNRVDEFLFNSRQGFCEHYASSFVMLMRYAGIPARVVTGYQGGQLAPDSKSWEVRQLDAHAWAEVLVNQQWQRIDPTAIIAPQRIDDGMQNMIEQDDRVFGDRSAWTNKNLALLTKVRVWSDYASYQWQSKVVGYNAESQRGWMEKLGLKSVYATVLIMFGSIVSLALIYLIWSYFKQYRRYAVWERHILRFNKKLPAHRRRQPQQTFRQWINNLTEGLNQNEQQHFEQLIQLYEQYHYGSERYFKEDLNKFKYLLKKCSGVLKQR